MTEDNTSRSGLTLGWGGRASPLGSQTIGSRFSLGQATYRMTRSAPVL